MARPRLENVESKLLAAGLGLFAREGVERVNSNSIARRAGVAVGTFYANFPNKYALLREIELRTLAGLRAARVAAIGEVSGDPAEQAKRSIGAAAQFSEQHPEAYRVTFGRERAGAARHGPVVSESARPLAEALLRIQRAGGIVSELDVDLAARAYLSMEVGTLLWWLEDPSRATRAGIVDTLSRLHPASQAQMDPGTPRAGR